MEKNNLPKSFWDLNPWNFPHLFDSDDDFSEMINSGLSLYKDQDLLCVEASIPGLSEKEINISLDGTILKIEGEKKEEEKDEHKHYYRRASSSYSYRVVLPEPVDQKQSPQTEYKNGILTLKFKRSGSSTKKK